ncbi:MAG: Ldh family oxidoreductase [Caldilineaceae bacterium]|nr:Ldh family oxidoreductase [Caldilineaceae bacterium]
MSDFSYLKAPFLHSLSRQLLTAAGTPAATAVEVSNILINANLAGHDSHGVLRIPVYLQQIADGKMTPAEEPQVMRNEPNLLHVDGRNGFGHYAAHKAMQWAIDKAQRETICCVTFSNLNHIGRVGEYAEAAARADCLGMITVGGGGQGQGSVAPFGGAQPALGTNPIAIGAPTGDDVPFVVDFATSVVAHGKIMVARSRNADLLPGCIVDKHGQPSVKPADFYDGGHLLTFANHKGYALSLFVALLGGLAGGFNPDRAAMSGAYMQVLNIGAFTDIDAYRQHVRAFLNGMKSTPPAAGFDEVLAPGDFEWRTRQERLANGVEVPESIVSQLRDWAERLNVPMDEGMVTDEDRARYGH